MEFRSTREFDELGGAVALNARDHREQWRSWVPGVVERILRADVPRPEDEETLRIARRFFGELAAAVDAGRLGLALLGDAFGVAAWAIDAPEGRAPHPARVTMLADDRVRYVIMNFPYGEPEPPTSTSQRVYA